MPLFSVIMPAYNREQFIGDALASVQRQTCGDWECIVVDDGSTDATRSIVKEIASKDSRVTLLEQANAGPGAARNFGASEATGRYLAFLDSDDIWMDWALATYRQALENAGWPEYLAGHQTTFSRQSDLNQTEKKLKSTNFRDVIDALSRGSLESGAGMTVVLADSFRKAGGFWEDRIGAEDNDLILRLGDCDGAVAVNAPVTLAYRRHGSQETESKASAVAGILRMVDREKRGVYPGGSDRAFERRSIIAAHARPVCLAALERNEFKPALRLFAATFPWQVRAGRWRFLGGFVGKYAWESIAEWSMR